MLAIAIAGEAAAERATAQLAATPERDSDRFRRFDRATALWLISSAVAGVIAVTLSDSALYGSLAQPSELCASALFGSVLGTGGPSVVALSALSLKGLSPGAALLAAALSSALGAKVLSELWRLLGPRGSAPVLIWLVCLTAAIGIGINKVAPIPSPLRLPKTIEQGAALLLFGLILLRAERVGVRRWLAGWRSSDHTHGHHGHDHAHVHSSEIPNGNAAT
jgi:hypothetical protein